MEKTVNEKQTKTYVVRKGAQIQVFGFPDYKEDVFYEPFGTVTTEAVILFESKDLIFESDDLVFEHGEYYERTVWYHFRHQNLGEVHVYYDYVEEFDMDINEWFAERDATKFSMPLRYELATETAQKYIQ